MAAEQTFDSPPATLAVQVDEIPMGLRALDQFLCWDWEFRAEPAPGKWTKPPMRVTGSGYGDSTKKATQGTFEQAIAQMHRNDYAGIGVALFPDDGVCFLDLDHCRDPETGIIDPWALDIIRLFRHTYHEISPSETGVKIIGLGALPVHQEGGNKHTKPVTLNARSGAKIELFDRAKYTTLTGHACHGSPDDLADVQASLDALYWKLFPLEVKTAAPQEPRIADVGDASDDELLAVAFAARNGHDVRALFDGNIAAHGGDHSVADLALCNHLAFYFGPDRARIDRVFRQSGLMRPKWNEIHSGDKATYGQMTIDAALAGKIEFYKPKHPKLRLVGQAVEPTQLHSQGDEHGGGEPPPPVDSKRPEIDAGDQNLEKSSELAWAALKRANDPPRLFRFGAVPVRIDRPDDDHVPIAQTLDENRLSHELARAASWFKETEKGGVKPAAPPMRTIKDMLAAPSYPFPSLLSIVQAPTFAKDGSLHSTPGYNPATRSFYAPPAGLEIPAVSDHPTTDEVAGARDLVLDELIGQFPFISLAERANAVALFFEPYVRNLIDGGTPLRLFEAPTAGCGKGLLADVLLRPAIGRRVNIMPAAIDDDEWRKRITAQLSELPEAIQIDNINRPLDSGSLAAALTALWWNDRRLGSNDMIRVPVRCIWIATANNPTMSTEIARRTVRIRLDPKVDRPWQRVGFKHEDLRSWVEEHRGRLIWAALTIVRAWLNQGAPKSKKRLGSFEQWAAVMGGILDTAGVEGFLDNLDEFYEVADTEGSLWRQFVEAWAEKFGENETGVSELFDIAISTEGFDFGKGSERSQRTSFGKQLGKQRDRVVGDYRIQQTRTVQRLKRWRLQRTRRPEPSDNGVHRVHECTSQPPTHSRAGANVIHSGAETYTDVHDVHIETTPPMWDDLQLVNEPEEYDPWRD